MTAPTVWRTAPSPEIRGSNESARQACPGLARMRIVSSVVLETVRDMGLSRPAGGANHPTRRQCKRHLSLGVHRSAAMGTQVERGHEPEFAQAGQLEPQDPPCPQFRVAQMPQGDPRCVEQPGMRIVIVGQIGQQFGDIVAGIQGRQIAAETCEALHRRSLGKEVQRLGRLGKQHDIRNAQQVKPTLEWRLEPSPPLGQRSDLPHAPG